MKLRSLDEVSELVKGRKVILAAGSFDIVVAQHVRFLQEARASGDVLVVAVRSDTSLKSSRDPRSPILDEGERVALVSSLRCVDFVVLLDEPDAGHLLSVLRPAAYVEEPHYQGQLIADRIAGNSGNSRAH